MKWGSGFARLASCGWAFTLCVACNQAPSGGVDPTAPSTEALGAASASEKVPGDRPSPTPIMVSWTDNPSQGTIKSLAGVVQNTTAVAQHVEMRLTGMAPTGEISVRSMGSLDIPAKSAVPVSYALADLPAQSTGTSSAILLSATYQVTGPSLGGPAVTRTLQATTPALHVTLDANGASATARDAASQARANAKKAPEERRVFSSLLYDAKAGRMVDAVARVGSQGELAPPVVGAVEGRPGEGPPGRANSLNANGVAP